MTVWAWDYDPSAEYETKVLPPGAVAEVEQLANELAALGRWRDCRSSLAVVSRAA
ncbi:hypothetical protein ACWDFL_17290 [Streptomyces bungoensis]